MSKKNDRKYAKARSKAGLPRKKKTFRTDNAAHTSRGVNQNFSHILYMVYLML